MSETDEALCRFQTIPPSHQREADTEPVVHTSNVCQRKEEFQTRRKGVKGWFHGKPPRGGGRVKSLEKQLVPLKFYHADQDRVTQWKNSEVVVKITRKTAMSNISSHG